MRRARSQWGKWPTPSKISSRLPGIAACVAWACRTGMMRVVVAPHDQRRHGRRQIELVGGADTLARLVDDRAQRLEEGGARLAGSASEP